MVEVFLVTVVLQRESHEFQHVARNVWGAPKAQLLGDTLLSLEVDGWKVRSFDIQLQTLLSVKDETNA